LATVWSAPNYCHRYENLASILELDEQLNEYFNIFEDAPENTRDKKEAKPRDALSISASESNKSRQSTGASSGGGAVRSRRDDFFI
jgi:hypothetical protein